MWRYVSKAEVALVNSTNGIVLNYSYIWKCWVNTRTATGNDFYTSNGWTDEVVTKIVTSLMLGVLSFHVFYVSIWIFSVCYGYVHNLRSKTLNCLKVNVSLKGVFSNLSPYWNRIQPPHCSLARMKVNKWMNQHHAKWELSLLVMARLFRSLQCSILLEPVDKVDILAAERAERPDNPKQESQESKLKVNIY